MIAQGTPTGIEVYLQLRSIDSPETQRFRVELPDRARMQQVGTAVEITREGKTLAQITAPAAIYAQGAQVPLALRSTGDGIEISTAHRDGDFAYPILVDPVVTIPGGNAFSDSWSVVEDGRRQMRLSPIGISVMRRFAVSGVTVAPISDWLKAIVPGNSPKS